MKYSILPGSRLALALCLVSTASPLSVAKDASTTQFEATDAYQKVITDPSNEAAIAAYMEVWLGADGFDRLRQHLKKQAADKKVTPDQLRAMAAVWRRLGDDEEALALLVQAAETKDAAAAVWLERAQLEFRIRRSEEATASLDHIAMSADPAVVRRSVELRLSIARQGGDRQAIARLRSSLAAEPIDNRLDLLLSEWEVEHGDRRKTAAYLRQRLAEQKDDATRDAWRRLLLGALLSEAKSGEAVRLAMEGVLASKPGTEMEARYVSAIGNAFHDLRFQLDAKPSPGDVIAAMPDRKAAVFEMVAVMKARGEITPAIEAIVSFAKAHPDDADARYAWADALAEAGRPAEGVSLFTELARTKPDDATAVARLAMMLREAGREAEGAKFLQTWALTPKANEARIRKAAALLPLFITHAEAKTWTETATKLLPKSEVAEIRKGEPVASRTADLKEIEESNEGVQQKIERLLELRRQRPADANVNLALINLFSSTNRDAEAWHLIITQHDQSKSVKEVRAWWQRVLADANTGRPPNAPNVLASLQSLRHARAGDVRYWIATAEVAKRTNDYPSQTTALTEALRLTPDDVTSRMELAEALANSRLSTDARRSVMPLLDGTASVKALMFLAKLDLATGRLAEAEREMAEIIDQPSLDLDDVEDLAVRFMGWRQWGTAAALLAAQQSAHPKDYRLAFLRALALKEMGARDEAIDAFLAMGGYHDEINAGQARRVAAQRYFGDAVPPVQKSDDIIAAWSAISSHVGQTVRSREIIRSLSGERSLRNSDQIFTLAPMTVDSCGHRAMAHLLDLAKDMDAEGKAALAERARGAGMPVPEALVIGRLEAAEGYANLLPDNSALSSRLTDPAMAKLWIAHHRFVRSTEGQPGKQSADEIELARRCFATLLPVDANTAMVAALLWWRNDFSSDEALAAVIDCVRKTDDDRSENIAGLLDAMRGHSSDLRRNPELIAPLLKALGDWRERVKNANDEADARAAVIIAQGMAMAGRWEEMATLLDGVVGAMSAAEAKRNSLARESRRQVGAMQPWMYLQPVSPLAWPLRDTGGESRFVASMLPPKPDGSVTGVPEEDREAFLKAGNVIKQPRLKFWWALAARDDKQIIEAAAAWAKSESANVNAVLAAASGEDHAGRKDRALDLLHGLIGKQADEDTRRSAQTLYLRAVFFSSGQDQWDSAGRPLPRTPPKAHEKKAAAVLRELHGDVIAVKAQLGRTWSPVFAAAGLKSESELLAGAQDEPSRRYGARQQADRDFFERTSRMDRRRYDEGIDARQIQRMLKEMPRERIMTLCLMGLRAEADLIYLQEVRRDAAIEAWQEVIKAHDLAAELMKAAEPGKVRTFRRLAHAMFVAMACREPKSAVAFGEEALKLEPDAAVLEAAVVQERLRAGGDVSGLLTHLKSLSPAETRRRITQLLNAARYSSEISQRLKLVEGIVKLAGEKPEMVRATPALRGNSRIITDTFKLLTEPFRIREGEVPPLFPDFRRSDSGKEKPNPESAEELAARKRLHGELCDIALKHPEWADETLEDLTIRHLIDDQPDAAGLSAYLRAAMTAQGEQSAWIFDNWMRQATGRTNASHRFKTARLALKLLPELKSDKGSRSDSYPQTIVSLAHLIGDQMRDPGWPMPLYALWEQAQTIDEGSPVYSPAQVTLNKERQELFTELWKYAEKNETWLSEALPLWAAFRLHFDNGKDEVLPLMRKLKDKPSDPYALSAVVNAADESFMMDSHVALAEVMETLLRDSKSLLDHRETPQLIERVMQLVSQGREHEFERPPLTATPEEAEMPERGAVSAALHKRRQAVYAALQEIISDRFPTTPQSLFTRLENELRAGKDTAKTEKLLMELAKTDRSKVEQALDEFVRRTEGRYKTVGRVKGYEGGVWELGLQVRWLGAAMRIGGPLLTDENGKAGGRTEWFSHCVSVLQIPNALADPPVPPAAGNEEGNGYARGSTRKLHATMPLQKNRDALLSSAFDLAMKHPTLRKQYFYRFAAKHLDEGPADEKAVLEVFTRLVNEDPGSAASGLNFWLCGRDGSPSLAEAMASARMVAKFVDAWPATGAVFSTNWFEAALRAVLHPGSSSSPLKKLPLVPGLVMNTSSDNMDKTLVTPGAKERHAAWVKILDAAALKPSLAPHVFRDLARLHVEEAPDRVLECLKLLLANDPEKLQWIFQTIYREEEPAPLERRLFWGRLVLHAMPLVKPLATAGSPPPTWLSATLTFLHGTRPDYGSSSGEVIIAPPTPEMLRERDEIVTKLTNEIMASPGIAIESLVPFARKHFQSGASPDAVLDLLKNAASNDAARVSDQVRAWCDALFTAKADVRERLWAAQTLVPLAEVWMSEHGPTNAYWLDSAANLIARRDGADATNKTDQQKMLDKLMDVTSKSPEATSRMIATYAMTMMDATKVTKRVLDLAAKDAAAAGKMMETWWSDGRLAYSRQNEHAGEMAVKILESWPPTASQDSLAWTLRTLRNLGEPLAEQSYFRPDSQKDDPIPGPGKTTLKQSIGREILSLLIKRQAKFDWMTAAQLRFALAPGRDATQQENAVAPIFKDERQRSEALAYVQRKLEVDFSLQKNPSFGSRSALRGVPPDPKVSETIDAVRCLLLAVDHAWLPEETTSPLLDRARSRLREIVMRRRANPNSSFYEDGELPGSQIETATELLKELAAPKDTAAATAKPAASAAGAASPDKELVILQPELLGERLDNGLRKGTAATRLGDDTRILLKSEPEKTATALYSWAGRLSQSHRARSYIAAGDVALNLAEHWTAEMPPPDWLVQFARYWPSRQWLSEPGEKDRRSEDIQASHKAEERILPKLRAALKKFPGCQNLDYFPTISPSGEPFTRSDAASEELATLALAHIKAHKEPSSGRRASLLPTLSFELDIARGKIPLFADLRQPDAHLFLLEHAWRMRRESWLRSTVIPAIKEGHWLSTPVMFDQLTALYFCDMKAFNQAADTFAMECRRSGSPESGAGAMWILRVARLRGVEIDAARWAHAADLSGQMIGYSGRAATAKLVVAWLAFRLEMQKEPQLDADLAGVIRAALGKSFPKRTEALPLDENFLHRRDNEQHASYSSPRFRDPICDWIWEALKLAIKQPEFHGAALRLADETGMLADRTCGESLMHAGVAIAGALSHEDMRRILKANRFSDEMPFPAREWLMTTEGYSPIWHFASRFGSSTRFHTIKWLEEDTLSHPTVGKALLLLGLRREKGEEIAPALIASTLSPCLGQLENESRDRLAALTSALLAVQPRLMDASTKPDASALLKLLPPPAQEPAAEATARRWREMTPDKIPSSDPASSPFRPLTIDLCRLLRAQSPQADAVFDAATKTIASHVWKGKSPPGVESNEWARAQALRSLLMAAQDFQSTRTVNSNGTLSSAPLDENRRCIPFHVIRFILRHAPDAMMAAGTSEFDWFVRQVWTQRLESLAWSGEAVAREILDLSPENDSDSTLLLLYPGFTKAVATAPFSTLEVMTATASKTARGHPAAWMLQCILECERQRRAGTKNPGEVLPAALVEEAKSIWETKGITPAVRSVLARIAPASVPVGQGKVLLDDWTKFMKATRPWGSAYDNVSWKISGSLKWLTSVKDKVPLQHSAGAAMDVLTEWLAASRDRAIYFTGGSGLTIYQSILAPLGQAVDSPERCQTLMAAAATARRLTYPDIFDELQRTPAAFIPRLFPEAGEEPRKSTLNTMNLDRQFTREDEGSLEKLREVKATIPGILATRLVLTASPDSIESPPRVARSARVTALVSELSNRQEFDEAALDELISCKNIPVELLEELLPLLRRHPTVRKWIGSSLITPPSGTGSPVRVASPLSLWALGETLHGGKPDAWKKLIDAFKKQDDAAMHERDRQLQSSISRIAGYSGSSLENGDNARWQRVANTVISHAAEWWIDQHPPAQWPRIVQPLIDSSAAGSFAGPSGTAKDVSFLLHHCLPSFSTKTLDDAFASQVLSRVQSNPALWNKIGSLKLSAAERWQHLAARRDSARVFTIDLTDPLLADASASGLLTAMEFVTLVDDAPLDTLLCQPAALVDWLISSGKKPEALRLISRIVASPPNSGSEKHWFLLAVMAHDLGDDDLAARSRAVGDQLRPGKAVSATIGQRLSAPK